ncbi:MAG: hypothetical protein IKH59_01780 [Bacteroidaceae bacterium]|nr:hypothetical protein [Bacteroidaceae bacterium]
MSTLHLSNSLLKFLFVSVTKLKHVNHQFTKLDASEKRNRLLIVSHEPYRDTITAQLYDR